MALPLSLLFGDWVLASNSRWSGKCLGDGPALGEPSPDDIWLKSKSRPKCFIPLGKCGRSRFERYQVIAASISALFSLVGPSTILWAVTLTIVDTFDRVAAWGLSHVTKKSREVIAPLAAHFDTPRAVIAVSGVGRTVASVLRCHPNSIFPGATSAVRSETSASVLRSIEGHLVIIPLGVA